MTTVRFLTRWFYQKSTRRKLRADVGREWHIKSTVTTVAKPKQPEPQIKWGNPARWHF